MSGTNNTTAVPGNEGGGGGGAGGAGGVPWHTTAAVPPEVLGLWQNKGWDVTDPAKVALSASQAYNEAQKFVGAPADQLVRLPSGPADEAGTKALWAKLGAPADVAGYDFAAVKRADGAALDPAFEAAFKQAALEANMPKDMATRIAASVVKHMDGVSANELAEKTAAVQKDKAELMANWGNNFVQNQVIAQNAVRALGIPPEAVAALEGQVGYSKVMEMFRNIGTKIGEASFVTGGGVGNGNNIMTKEGAGARLTELKQDSAWVSRYMSGDAQAGREMSNLMQIITA